jgi:hypothetical protein
MDPFSLLFMVVPWVAVYLAARHGPVRNPLWRGENPLGFALFVGGISFLLGFVGPILVSPGANQGPLLGIFISGPLGFLLGLLWGALRALRRREG